jgi:hypothetical protein
MDSALRMLTMNGEGLALGLNYGGTDCLVSGTANGVPHR